MGSEHDDERAPHKRAIDLAAKVAAACGIAGVAAFAALGVEAVTVALAVACGAAGCVVATGRHNRARDGEKDSTAVPPLPDGFANNASATAGNDATRVVSPKHEATPLSPADAKDDEAPAEERDDATSTDVTPSVLDFDALMTKLVSTADPVAELRLFVGDVRARERAATPTEDTGKTDEAAKDGQSMPSGAELYAARVLEEAALFSNDVDLPSMRCVRLSTSGLPYLRVTQRELPYLARLRVLKLEAALTAIQFVASYFDDDLPTVTVEDCYKLNQEVAASICAQFPPIAQVSPTQDGDEPDGEWAVRRAISTALETVQLPYRLAAKWRANVSYGNVAFEVALTPEAVWPSSMFVPGVGLVTSSREMRRKAASAYALRVALLLASVAFRSSEKIRHVWVAGTIDTATRHRCYLSVDFDRGRFAHLDLSNTRDLASIYRSFVPQMRLEEGILRPVAQGFSLSEPRFCPPNRYVPVSLSSKRLPAAQAKALGTERVYGLSIEEAEKRALVAADIMSRFAPKDDAEATQKNVRTILSVAGDDPDPTVRGAAERCVAKLVSGEIEDAEQVGEEFVVGDALDRAAQAARTALQRNDYAEGARITREALSPIDARGDYRDTPTVVWRYFGSYVDRAMYNRLLEPTGASTMLVPDAYYECNIALAMCLLASGQGDEALHVARRLCELAPLDRNARLLLVRCLEGASKRPEAEDQLREMLDLAHDPETLGVAYYRMGYFMWQDGDVTAAQACYALAMNYLPNAIPVIAMELIALSAQGNGTLREEMTAEEIQTVLESYQIPMAPTERVSSVFYDCVRASLDAEVFPVARNFVHVLASFAPNDILMGVIRSMEGEPDE
ncbi:MAG: tetratricopeptide repeat protein [Olsenella sp.]|jgi:tetratricopeptide (TPR) repeat protein|nr:tetratricopeptide repeat protein [Olsenella sp.]